MLGQVVEQLTEQYARRLLQENVFKPLGMADTALPHPGRTRRRRYAKALRPIDRDGRPQWLAALTSPRNSMRARCAASTASDYLRFAQMLLNKGKVGDTRILGARKTVEYMLSNQLGPEVKNLIRQRRIRPAPITASASDLRCRPRPASCA